MPPEPLPPPAPLAPAESSRVQSDPDKQPGLPIGTYWSRMTSRVTTGRSTPVSPLSAIRQGRHAAAASNSLSNRTMGPHLAGNPFGSFAGTDSTGSIINGSAARSLPSLSNVAHDSRQIESVSSPALQSGDAWRLPRSALAEVETMGPTITPLQQPMATRSGVIESWPYRSQPSPVALGSRRNAPPQRAIEASITPPNETQFGSTELPPLAAPEAAAAPSLLPPGP